MTRAGPKGTYAAPAIEKAFEILEMLANQRDGALVSEMATRLNRSVGELFRVVIVMEQLGYLQKSAKSDRYTAAYKLLDLAYRATPAQNLIHAALPEMRQLAIETGQSCHFVVPNGGEGLVIAREENPGERGFSLRLGAAIDMVRSCSGQVILAFSKPDRADHIIAEAEAVQGAPADRDWLAERLATIRRDGFDHRKSPITHGVTDISYPVFGFDRDVVGALTIPFLALIDGSQKVDFETARRLLQAAAGNISATLGYAPTNAVGSSASRP
ncbi:IclR family transcriptional regulator [Nitrospirillum iridis]|uniref:DNA-binding IclR family transcriptional regulator n=1 Tax=Nitrospirillum iridis TaxID=765888 RepID=A0A7X0EDU7_9PROT|nr:IclR family transcriptional regulator [Nitrospirillum iridis]MBB6252420.1 DNA-binding IclR family transcriptional regulator [Nitrospirillum iridis]